MSTCHVVAMPSAGRGHINPMMNLCKLLASRSHHILVTFVVTEEWLGFIGSDPKPDNIRFRTIPNVLPSELVRAANMAAFVEATMTKMEEPFERLLDRLDTPATVIVADAFLNWAVEVGNRRNIPVASLWPMPASVYSLMYHFDLLVQNGHFPIDLSERGEERVEYIPGLSPIRLADLPTIFHSKDQQHLRKAFYMISKVPQSKYLLFSSIYELESPVVDALQLKFPIPIYSFGPLIPYFNLDLPPSHTIASQTDHDYLKWLNSQPQSSVLYVSMGSFLSVSSDQMDEIVAGLRDSGVRCLWVARDKTSRLKEACGNSGMVVPWCDQLKVKKDEEMDKLVTREEIAELVQMFMNLENPERKEMMKRVREIREICRRAIEKGGSFESNIDAFVKVVHYKTPHEQDSTFTQIHTIQHKVMAPESVGPMATCHVVAMPSAGRGHINPMMNLCKLLASRSHHILVTFVVTEEWLGFIGSDPKPDNIRFRTIPNVLPSELVRAANMAAFIEATMTKMEEPFERLLDRLETPATIIVADGLLSWAVEVGNRRNITVASLWPIPASMYSLIYHFDLLVQNGHFPVDLSERGEERVEYIPGLSPIRLVDLPTIFRVEDKQGLLKAFHMISKVPKSQYLLFSSIYELESPVVDALQLKFPIPIYSIGPLIPYFNLEHPTSHTIASQTDYDYLKWLDSQPQSSVLYISMGSFLSVSSDQMDEIVAGLRDSGVRCLWVARDKASRLEEACGSSGMVVPWCDQLKVKKDEEMDKLVTREKIVELVQTFMNLENPERKEMMKRVREIREICRRAIEKGGSFESNIDAFVKDIFK
ncbi:UDP-glycosyltransferase 87A1 [Camellia lanceoleosa]|uniref:UDP-glycosyltransferase 87A1 n=1 Tax=Camellia lanceoleosa TaxID=1840588 RepID=A0ACC0F1R7_9ERIC|nr:UDP-glycosyltransferase 87A1 [Camellia lanceoleosa]